MWQDRAQLAFLRVAAANDVDVFHSPMTKECFDRICPSEAPQPKSSYPMTKGAHTPKLPTEEEEDKSD